MSEALKWIAGGGSFGTLVAIYFILKIEPRLRSIEMTYLLGQQIDLLKLVKELAGSPDAHEAAQRMLKDVESKIDRLKE